MKNYFPQGLILLAGFVLLLLVHTATSSDNVQLELAGHTFTIELAITPSERSKGLMNRTHMPDSNGMLFVYEQADSPRFWMKNTLIPLDIMFFDQDGKLLHYHDNAPPCRTATCPHYGSPKPAHYVLELNAGKRQAIGLKPGDTFTILAQPN